MPYYENWHRARDRKTVVHADHCKRKPTYSHSKSIDRLIHVAIFNTLEAAVRHTVKQGHKVHVCKVCCPESGRE